MPSRVRAEQTGAEGQGAAALSEDAERWRDAARRLAEEFAEKVRAHREETERRLRALQAANAAAQAELGRVQEVRLQLLQELERTREELRHARSDVDMLLALKDARIAELEAARAKADEERKAAKTRSAELKQQRELLRGALAEAQASAKALADQLEAERAARRAADGAS